MQGDWERHHLTWRSGYLPKHSQGSSTDEASNWDNHLTFSNLQQKVQTSFLLVKFAWAHQQKKEDRDPGTQRHGSSAFCQPRHWHIFLSHPFSFNCCLPSPPLLQFSQETRVIKTALPFPTCIFFGCCSFPYFPQKIIHSHLNPKFMLILLYVWHSFKVSITANKLWDSNHDAEV